MSSLEAALQRIAGELAATRRDWALVGGLAVSARAEPRTTRDVDVAVDVVDDAQAEWMVREHRERVLRVAQRILVSSEGALVAPKRRLASPPYARRPPGRMLRAAKWALPVARDAAVSSQRVFHGAHRALVLPGGISRSAK